MGIPEIEYQPTGTLWAAAYTGGPKEPDPANKIVVITSTDDGRTWSLPRTVADPPGDTRAFDPTLWMAPDGGLWLIYNVANLAEQRHQVWVAVNPTPDDPDSSFGPGRPLDLGVPYAFRMNKPLVLRDGRTLLPVTWAPQAPDNWFAGPAQRNGVAIWDDQDVWQVHGSVEAPHWALENMLVERRDGSLWMLIRAGGGKIWESVSTDGGLNWSAGRPTAIDNPGSRSSSRGSLRATCSCSTRPIRSDGRGWRRGCPTMMGRAGRRPCCSTRATASATPMPARAATAGSGRCTTATGPAPARSCCPCSTNATFRGNGRGRASVAAIPPRATL